MAVMELKRTLVTVQEMSLGDSPDIKAKSGEVVAGIESLLAELGVGTQAGMPAGIVSLEEAPAPVAVPTEEPVAEEPAPAEEATTHEAAVEEAAPVVVEEASEPAQEEPAEEASEESSGEASEESSEGGDDDEEEEDDE